MTDKLTAFNEERELARREPHNIAAVAPERGESTALKALSFAAPDGPPAAAILS